jgi:hypothetical protein
MNYIIEINLTQDDIKIIDQIINDEKEVDTQEQAILWALRKMRKDGPYKNFGFLSSRDTKISSSPFTDGSYRGSSQSGQTNSVLHPKLSRSDMNEP